MIQTIAKTEGEGKLLCAATRARGTTRIENAAREPKVEDLARVVTSVGAGVAGAATDTIAVQASEREAGCQVAIS